MRLSLSVNGASPVDASLSGPGYLNAHLNMQDHPQQSDRSKKIRLVGRRPGNWRRSASAGFGRP
jgi:hypothetical protein